MERYEVRTQYGAVVCSSPQRRGRGSILLKASSLPGSRTLRYIPREPILHNYGIDPKCVIMFRTPLVWKGEHHDTDVYRNLSQKLRALPIEEGSFVTYMRDSGGFFFNLKLKGDIRITISQYEDELERGAYVNVMLGDEVLIQDYMSVDDIVESMKNFYGTE